MNATTTKLKVIITLDDDVDTDSPFKMSDWSLRTIRMGKIHDVADDWTLNDELAAPVLGTNCWQISCYRHSCESWFLATDRPNSCKWDTRKTAGFLVYKGADPLENPEEAAREMIKEYDLWVNGDCYWYRIEQERDTGRMRRPHACESCQCPMIPEDPEIEEESSCGGLIGWSYTKETIRDELRAMTERKQISPETYVIELNISYELWYLKQELQEELQALGYSIV